MNNNDLALQNLDFLKQLDQENIKTFYTKILVLDKDELPIRSIEGRVTGGSISINGSSNVRRSGSVTFIAEETENDLTNVDNLLALNKKIQILIGLENHINSKYDDIIWFPQGIFVIVDPSISHSTSGVTINLQFKDKMCLLNGDCGGKLPTSVSFDKYNQMIAIYDGVFNSTAELIADLKSKDLELNNYSVYKIKEGEVEQLYRWDAEKSFYKTTLDALKQSNYIEEIANPMYDIIQTLVANFGGEDLARIIIEDVPRYTKSSVRVNSGSLWYNGNEYKKEEPSESEIDNYIEFKINEECGYEFTKFTYPGKDLTSSIGDSVTSVLDKLISALGNHEYFYDINGNFVFREKKNYLNTQYDPVVDRLGKIDGESEILLTTSNDKAIVNEHNYQVDFSNNSASIYTFNEETNLITSYSNAPKYTNIKNDFHIWGKNQDKLAIHYHLAIKEKPLQSVIESKVFKIIPITTDEEDKNYGKIELAKKAADGQDYICDDWRAYLYLCGLEKKQAGLRPDIYEQELLDLFDSIYNMYEKKWKMEANRPNDLLYWFDYLAPKFELANISVDAIGPRVHSYQQDSIRQLYSTTIPNKILIHQKITEEEENRIKKLCDDNGILSNKITRVSDEVYNSLASGSYGYSAQEVARSLIYQYIDFNAGISLNIIPIYYLDVNNRITVYDRKSGISGDYVVNSINVPLDGKNTMSISATRALERI